jgi:nicotinate-nucleotide pyrophosphorylase (carboxylating)
VRPEVSRQARPDLAPPLPLVRTAVEAALREDLGQLGDLTASLVGDRIAEARLVAREGGRVAGLYVIPVALSLLGADAEVTLIAEEGQEVSEGAEVAVVRARARALLSTERTILNFVCHLSGVATLTAAFVGKAQTADPRVRILDTRKTLPGLRALQKAAVRAGGGHNHRAALGEAVLVKDNHLVLEGVSEAVARAKQLWPMRTVEVECDGLAEVEEAVSAGADAVLLDNMAPSVVAEAVALVRSFPRQCLVEVSGGVSLDNVAEYAAAGPDFISVGALTHSAPALDMGLDFSVAE